MARDYDSAVRAGAMAAGRLHRRLDTQALIGRHGGNVDVFGAIHALDLPLLLRPLKGLLGAYLSSPAPGVLVTTERPMSIQRFTAAHELGHFFMRHEPSLDDESILRRMPMSPEPGNQFQETEADAFAIAFMIPKWLIALHCARQGWTVDELRRPNIAYQLSLRIGASYEATCRTLFRYKLISDAVMRELLETKPRSLKVDLLHDYRPADYRGDVWLLTERDEGARIDGSRNDLFVLRLKEHSGGGFLWDLDQLMASGFAVVRDEREAFDAEAVGGPVVRRVTAAPEAAQRGRMSLNERRPWQSATANASLTIDFDFTGPEQEGLSRAERRHLLEAA
ncbi:ImmA/IrrE family metallo-endopeptidase [Sphingopyxis indica]|uniref:Chagasin family peptidase inhibitor I42 n=1 Tax=Sphingopyxis indica TaxID=436663 RepID=A0A239IUZ6_9SPHN|nr:ImmA/IrrE family metallo-endopeptidase [Sphingopyxis indica]SNS97411.1 Chagasin family peptidase inhibitor I42 [Sphingopyxis indica]